jgi:hypothetical protein
MTDFDKEARDAVEGRRRRFPVRPLEGLPEYDVIVADTMRRFPTVMKALHDAEKEDHRRLRVNDNLDVRRSGGRILVTAGPIQMEISPEEARRAADALSAFAAVADADDVEVEEVRRAA